MNEKIILQYDNVTVGYRYYTPTTGGYFVRIDTGNPFGISETFVPAPPPKD